MLALTYHLPNYLKYEKCWKIWNAEEDEMLKHFLVLVVLQAAGCSEYLGCNVFFKSKEVSIQSFF